MDFISTAVAFGRVFVFCCDSKNAILLSICFTILESIVWIIDAKNLESDCINASCRDGGEVVNEMLSGMNGVMDVFHCISVDKDNISLVTCLDFSFLFDIA